MSYLHLLAETSGTPLGKWIKKRSRQNTMVSITPLIAHASAPIPEIGLGWGELALFFRDAGYRNYTTVEPNQVMRNQLLARGFVTKDYLIPKIAELDPRTTLLYWRMFLNIEQH